MSAVLPRLLITPVAERQWLLDWITTCQVCRCPVADCACGEAAPPTGLRFVDEPAPNTDPGCDCGRATCALCGAPEAA